MPSKLWGEITNQIPTYNSAAIEVILSHAFNECNYLSMLQCKLNHVSEIGPMWLILLEPQWIQIDYTQY